ncbi:MAG: HNH endonuclease signature motif containing protein [Rhodoferax sp.]|nr:HNH endonuclease signature motif containing protein [Rhodoferax sp.]MDP3654377.1 HNH endonuclease signature motif containing protein [Rhodoferax sp.]
MKLSAPYRDRLSRLRPTCLSAAGGVLGFYKHSSAADKRYSVGIYLTSMAISDKTRKILWGRSGNRCSICRQRLVVDETTVDAGSVVGDECHINSGASNGPRHDAAIDPQRIDDLANLLLLCRVHHKMVDDQFETYTATLLSAIKANHERWVDSKLKESEDPPSLRVRRFKNEIPALLQAARSGQDLFNLASECHGSYQHHSDDLSDDEVEVVGGFLQNLKDWVDIASDLEPIDKVRAVKSLTDELQELKDQGFLVFAAKERQRLEGGISAPSDFFVLHVSVVRENDAGIVRPEGE